MTALLKTLGVRSLATDAQLLGQFIRDCDDSAFSEIVHRHGPLVLGVCRRVIPDRHLADDAFQAAFVVLARKAAGVQPADRLACWLYGVSYRVALRARTMAGRRTKRESLTATPPETPLAPQEIDENIFLLDEAIARLPRLYRDAVVLCELQGVGRREAARQLGVAPGTLSSRLAKARKLLAAALTRRGVTLPAVLTASVVVTPDLCNAAMRAATGTFASATVRQLSEGIVRTMVLSKLKAATAVALVGALLLGGLGVGSMPASVAPEQVAKYEAPKTAPTAAVAAKDLDGDPKPGEERSFEIAEGVKMVFCWIPKGTATLGSPEKEKDRSDDEKEHEYVEKKGFWLGKYPVTQREWMAVMEKKMERIYFRADGEGADAVKGMDTSRFPAERISWTDSQDFLAKVNKRPGVGKVFGQGKLVLPHEDRWEYAYRGGKGNKTAYYWGDELNGDKANCNGKHPYGTSDEGDYLKRPTKVGEYETKAPHPWGLCDMSGNVWQWCDNLYGADGATHVLRGGAWYYLPKACRAAYRNHEVASNDRLRNAGFRVSIVLE